ncbi:hypothetical protein Scep_003586 [Stephania cephalantha]|uniref:Flavone synthase II n=1 Tax=Stephania cephalantha TaxID=152367 RepID=A0AAP0PUI8_9MAGN
MADLKDYSLPFLIFLTSIFLLRTMLSRNGRTHRLPPSPFRLPIIGHLHLFGPIPHQTFHKLSTTYGPVIHIYIGSVPCVIASSAEVAKEFLKTHELSFSSRPQSAAVHYITYGSADFSFAPYGPYWKFMKKLCMSELLGGRTLEQLEHVRREEIHRFLRSLLVKSNKGEGLVDLHTELIRLANNVISRMIMSRRCSESENDAEEIRELIEEIAELTGKFNLSDYIWFCRNLDLQGFRKRFEEAHAKYDRMIENIIREHEEVRKSRKDEMAGSDVSGQEVKDILHILLDISEDDDAEMRLTRENIKAFILDMFAAGTDTSAITVEWALAELINNQHILEKAREEIDKAVGKNRLVEESDIPNLPYLQAIVKETLRLHPTGPIIVRESTEDCAIGDYHIPAKTRLFVNLWAIGRDPKHWENPLEFNPDRFIGSGLSKVDMRGQHYHFMPFGSGRRGCPGTTLALQVVQTALASVIQCFELKIGDGTNMKVDMTEGAGLTLPRAHPLICTPVPRLDPLHLVK